MNIDLLDHRHFRRLHLAQGHVHARRPSAADVSIITFESVLPAQDRCRSSLQTPFNATCCCLHGPRQREIFGDEIPSFYLSLAICLRYWASHGFNPLISPEGDEN